MDRQTEKVRAREERGEIRQYFHYKRNGSERGERRSVETETDGVRTQQAAQTTHWPAAAHIYPRPREWPQPSQPPCVIPRRHPPRPPPGGQLARWQLLQEHQTQRCRRLHLPVGLGWSRRVAQTMFPHSQGTELTQQRLVPLLHRLRNTTQRGCLKLL